MNKSMLTGRITANPELKQTQSGISVTQFTVAVARPYRKDKPAESDFISVVAWRQTAEFVCRNFKKGDCMEVVGSIRTRTYDDRRYPDVKHYATELYADEVSFTVQNKSDKGDNSGGYNNTTASTYKASKANTGSNTGLPAGFDEFEEIIGDTIGDDDLPF